MSYCPRMIRASPFAKPVRKVLGWPFRVGTAEQDWPSDLDLEPLPVPEYSK